MRFRISGAFRETGEECTIELEAKDRETAIFLANRHHVLVNLCETIPSSSDIPAQTDQPAVAPRPALICPECHRPILVNAEACPHCGFPLEEKTLPSTVQASKICNLTVIVKISRLFTLNMLNAINDTCTVDIGDQQAAGSAKAGFTSQFTLSPGEHILKTMMAGGSPGKFRIHLPEPGEYELRLGANQMNGTLFGTPKLPVKRIK